MESLASQPAESGSHLLPQQQLHTSLTTDCSDLNGFRTDRVLLGNQLGIKIVGVVVVVSRSPAHG